MAATKRITMGYRGRMADAIVGLVDDIFECAQTTTIITKQKIINKYNNNKEEKKRQ